jgi:DNA-binding CsgD family transcriptional regulator
MSRVGATWQNVGVGAKTLALTLAELRSYGGPRQRRATREVDAAAALARLIAACRTLAVEARGSSTVFRLAGDTEHHAPFSIVCWLRGAHDGDSLTPAETAVAALLCDGNTLAQIARLRGVSINTVKSQVRQVFRKLNVDSRVALVRRWCP